VSRAARGWEVKVLSRDNNEGIIQLDGFKQDVRGSAVRLAQHGDG
jgi:hypothetical protein